MGISMSIFHSYPLIFCALAKGRTLRKYLANFLKVMLTSSTSGKMEAILVGQRWEHDVHSTSKVNVNQRLEKKRLLDITFIRCIYVIDLTY